MNVVFVQIFLTPTTTSTGKSMTSIIDVVAKRVSAFGGSLISSHQVVSSSPHDLAITVAVKSGLEVAA
jgi:hypothetical protein